MGVPVVANGDIRSEEDVSRVCAETGVAGKRIKSSYYHVTFTLIFQVSCQLEAY